MASAGRLTKATTRPTRAAVLGSFFFLVVATTAGCGAATTVGSSLPARATHTTAVTAASGVIEDVPAAPAETTLLATLHSDTPAFAEPDGKVVGSVPGSWHGAPSVLPVLSSSDGYVDVRLAQRPNESTAWISASAVTFSWTPYRIVIDVAQTHLVLYEYGRQILSAPAGVGVPQYPTPTGEFFVAFFAEPPSPGYGPFVMVTSAHSDFITDWEESGDGMVAIHGPLGDSAEIGTTGAEVSHGCVRLQLSDLSQLRQVPVGSPIDITDPVVS